MPSIDEVLAPARALESLVRRAQRGHRPSWRVLHAHLPVVIRAEGRWLYPALLCDGPGGASRAWLLPACNEHEQVLELVERIGPRPIDPRDAMFVALLGLLRSHLRTERAWIAEVLTQRAAAVESGPLARYVTACRPLVAEAARLA